MNDEADEVIEKISELLKDRYQNNLESLKGSEFVFDYVYLLYYKCHKINPSRGGLYIQILVIGLKIQKKKKKTINAFNKKDNKYFQYPAIVALNH